MNQFGMTIDDDGYFRVPSAVNDWINEYVMEENGMANNKERVNDSLWHAFSFEAVNTDAFDLVPFYLGASECLYNFHMVVIDPDHPDQPIYDEEIWNCTNTLIQWTNGDPTDPTNNSWNSINGSPGAGGHGSTIDKSTRGKPILIDFSDPKYGLQTNNKKYTVYFYIYIDKANSHGHSAINEKDDVLTSITHQPNLVVFDLPDSIDSKLNDGGRYNSMVFACETGSFEHANKLDDGRADFDYNDFMFILVGRIPDIYYDEMLQTIIIKKRYMVEDLYGYDYDFNDIVVDVTQTDAHYYIVNEENGIKTEEEKVIEGISYPIFEQVATIVHECGTLPYQIKVGNFTFGQVTNPTDVDLARTQLARAADVFGGPVTVTVPMDYQGNEPNFSKTGNLGWKPDLNNITAFIWTKGPNGEDPTPSKSYSYTQNGLWTGAEGIWVSTFPEQGAVPYIIAVDQNVVWMREFKHIPTNWLGGDMSTDSSTTSTEEYISSH